MLLLFEICYNLSPLENNYLNKRASNMANIEKRSAKNGKISFRVKVRLKGFPTQQALKG